MFNFPFQFSFLNNPQNPLGMAAPQTGVGQGGPMGMAAPQTGGGPQGGPMGLLGGPNPMAFMQNPMFGFGMRMMQGRRRPMGQNQMNPMMPFGPFGGM